MVMNWTDTHDKEMLLHIIAANTVKVDNEAIAAHLNSVFGTNATAKAVKEHLAKVKKTHEAVLVAGGSAPSTPTKAKAGNAAKADPTTTPKRGKKVAVADLNDDDDDDDDGDASPSKKRKVAPRSSRKVTPYKEENAEEGEWEILGREGLGEEVVKEEEEVESEEE